MNTEPIPCEVREDAKAPGTVNLTFMVNVPPAAVWRALTDPAVVRAWFGSLSVPLREGGSAILDFGDGDFFTLEDIRLTPPYLVQYNWRFLGIGPQETICWHMAPRGNACAVTVTDTEDDRPVEMAILLREGWLDFTARLDQFFTTGRPTRYDWRREFDGSIELPCPRPAAWEALMGPRAIPLWLRLDRKAIESGAHLILATGREYERFEIAGVVQRPPDHVSFEVHHPRWSRPTHCRLYLSDRRTGSLLSVNHVGWEELSPDPQEPPRHRLRFSRFWIEALTRARGCCGSVSDRLQQKKEIL